MTELEKILDDNIVQYKLGGKARLIRLLTPNQGIRGR